MREMSSITLEFGTCKQRDGAAGAEAEQAEYRAQSELRAVYSPATEACLGVLGIRPQPVARTAVSMGEALRCLLRGALSFSGTV